MVQQKYTQKNLR